MQRIRMKSGACNGFFAINLLVLLASPWRVTRESSYVSLVETFASLVRAFSKDPNRGLSVERRSRDAPTRKRGIM